MSKISKVLFPLAMSIFLSCSNDTKVGWHKEHSDAIGREISEELLKNTLDKEVFALPTDKTALNHMLETLDHIKAVFVSREKYNQYKKEWTIIEKMWEVDAWSDYHSLYLPDDMLLGEQLFIIHLLNNTFDLTHDQKWNQMVVDFVTNFYHHNISQDGMATYFEHYGYDNDLAKVLTACSDSLYTILSHRGGARIDTAWIQLWKKLQNEFHLTFLRKWLATVRQWLEIMTQVEQKALIARCESKNSGFEKVEHQDGTIEYYNQATSEIIIINKQYLDQEETKLRDKMQIDQRKQKLTSVRKTNNQQAINQQELEVTNYIIKTLYESYPYQKVKQDNWYQLSRVRDMKELYCIWHSLLGHAFLSECGIAHQWLDIAEHSALSVQIGGEEYYFDATWLDEVYRFTYGTTKESIQWVYKEMIFPDQPIDAQMFANAGDPEDILLTHVYNNKATDLFDLWYVLENHQEIEKYYTEAIAIYDRALALNPEDAYVYKNKGITLADLWYVLENDQENYYIKAIAMYDKAIELNPNDVDAYYRKASALSNLWDVAQSDQENYYIKAIAMYDKVIEFSPNDVDVYNDKGNSLSYLWDVVQSDKEKKKCFIKAIAMYDRALELDPENGEVYTNKQLVLLSIKDLK